MGRDTIADATPLLKAAEQNIGNSAILQPQAGLPTVIPQTNPARILDLSGGSGAGQTTSIIFTATRLSQGADNPNPGFPGPITGILEFGNGGRFTRIEFDIPVGPFDGSLNVASNAVEPQDGMVIVQVPTGIVRAYARYDNLLLAPLLGTNPPMSAAQWNGTVPIVGPGGPVTVDNPTPPPTTVVVPSEPVLVKAMTAYFGKARSKVYKTLNCYISNEVAVPAQISDRHSSCGPRRWLQLLRLLGSARLHEESQDLALRRHRWSLCPPPRRNKAGGLLQHPRWCHGSRVQHRRWGEHHRHHVGCFHGQDAEARVRDRDLVTDKR